MNRPPSHPIQNLLRLSSYSYNSYWLIAPDQLNLCSTDSIGSSMLCPHRSMELIILKFASITSWYGPELSFTITNSNNAQQKRRATYRYASFSLCPFLLVIYFEGETSLAHLIIFCQRNLWDSPLNYFVLIKPTATARSKCWCEYH